MNQNPRIAIVVPARAGSQGILRKNLQDVHGRELVLRAIHHAKYLSEIVCGIIILSTDSKEVINKAKIEFGLVSPSDRSNSEFEIFEGIILHYRPAGLATSESLIMDTIVRIRDGMLSVNLDIQKWCLLQPTSPFRSKSAMAKVAKLLSGDDIEDFSLVSLAKVDDMHPARMYQLHGLNAFPLQGYEDHYYKRRQDLPPVYIRDGAYYLLSDDLVSRGVQYSKNPSFFVQKYPWTINVDTLEDLQLARMVEEQLLLEDPNS